MTYGSYRRHSFDIRMDSNGVYNHWDVRKERNSYQVMDNSRKLRLVDRWNITMASTTYVYDIICI